MFDARGLLDAWQASYDLHRNVLATHRSPLSLGDLYRIMVDETPAIRHRYALTLWSGARLRLPHVVDRTAHLALYWRGSVDELSDLLRLDKTRGETGVRGETYVFCFQPYDEALLWGMEAIEGLYVAHPLQLYLDLASGDAGEVALAQRAREELLAW